MKKLLSALLAICMVCMFTVPVFADANDDYIAAVKAYQQKIAAKEAAYTAAVNAYSKQAKAKADADSAAILKAAKAAQAKADAECLAVIAAGKAAHLGGVVAAFTPLPVIGVPGRSRQARSRLCRCREGIPGTGSRPRSRLFEGSSWQVTPYITAKGAPSRVPLPFYCYCSFARVASASSRMRSNFSRAASTGAGVARSTPAWRNSSSG